MPCCQKPSLAGRPRIVMTAGENSESRIVTRTGAPLGSASRPSSQVPCWAVVKMASGALQPVAERVAHSMLVEWPVPSAKLEALPRDITPKQATRVPATSSELPAMYKRSRGSSWTSWAPSRSAAKHEQPWAQRQQCGGIATNSLRHTRQCADRLAHKGGRRPKIPQLMHTAPAESGASAASQKYESK